MKLRMSVFLLLVLSSAHPAPAQQPNEPSKVRLAGSATVITADPARNQTEAILTLRNDSAQPITVVLTAKSAENSPVQMKFSGEKETGAGNDSYSLSVPASGTANVRAVVHSSELKDVQFEISDKSTSARLGTVTVSHAAFSVKLDGPSPEKAKLTLVRCRRTRIILKNDDDVPHTLKWELASPAVSLCSGDQVVLPARGLGILDCTPYWRRTSGYVQNLLRADPSHDGYQLALYSRDSGEPKMSAPTKIIPAEATLDYVDPLRRRVISTTVVIVLLVLGGVCSLVLNFLLPNRLLRLNTAERFDSLARKTADLSTRIDSRLSVLLRLERSRMAEMMKSRWTLSPDFAGVINQVASNLTKLETRVDLVQEMDTVLGSLGKALTMGVPPSLIEDLEINLRKASLLLSKSDPSDAAVQAARSIIEDAAVRVDTLAHPSDDFRKALLDQIKDFVATLADVKDTDTFKRITADVPGPYKQIQQVQASTATLPSGSEAAYDLALQQMKLIAEYARLTENTRDAETLARLSQGGKMLQVWLQSRSWSALQSARLLVREMGDDVYPGDLRAALLDDEVTIGMDPAVAYDQAPLVFSACFRNPRLEGAAAKEKWSCNWNFDDGLTEKGWSVSHYYLLRDKKESRVGRLIRLLRSSKDKAPDKNARALAEFHPSVTFIDEVGQPIKDSEGNLARVSATVPVRARARQKIGERTMTEGIKLAAALLIAIFGLLAGAQTQLDKLDVLPGLVAVFMVGFGADTIKNILTK